MEVVLKVTFADLVTLPDSGTILAIVLGYFPTRLALFNAACP